MAVKKAAKKAATRKVNREGQRWTEDRPGMTLRLPLDLREAITEESRVKGDLARIVLFALSHVDHDEVDIQQTRKAGMELTKPQLLHVGAEARANSKNGRKPKASASMPLSSAYLTSSSRASRRARRCERIAAGASFVSGILAKLSQFCFLATTAYKGSNPVISILFNPRPQMRGTGATCHLAS